MSWTHCGASCGACGSPGFSGAIAGSSAGTLDNCGCAGMLDLVGEGPKLATFRGSAVGSMVSCSLAPRGKYKYFN